MDWDFLEQEKEAEIYEAQEIMNIIPSKGSFISGSYAVHCYLASIDLPSKDYNDIDYYFETEDDFNKAYKGIIEKYPNIDLVKTKNAITLLCTDNNIQLIRKYFGTPDEILSNFDLNNSKCYIKNGRAEALEDFNPIEIEFTKKADNEFSLAHVYRFVKYLYKNYTYTDETFKYMIKKIYSDDFKPTIDSVNYDENDKIKYTVPEARYMAIRALSEVKLPFVSISLHNELPNFLYHDPKFNHLLNNSSRDNTLLMYLSPSYWLITKYVLLKRKNKKVEMTPNDYLMLERVKKLYPEYIL